MEEALVLFLQLAFGLFQVLLEAALEVLLNLPFDWLSSRLPGDRRAHLGVLCMIWFCAGCALGWISLQFYPHSLIPLRALRILNLLLAPLLAAWLAATLARRRAVLRPAVEPRVQFWQSFWFVLGVAALRFAWIGRG